MKNILIVEDDTYIHNLIKENLENNGYKTLNAYTGIEALKIIKNNRINLILLDLMLPELNGEEIIKEIKNIPIIVISAKIAPEDKINVLLNGANDYITKPFNSEELLARIKVQLRINNENEKLEYNDLSLDEESRIAYLQGKAIYLTRTECTILKQLLLNPSKVVTKSKILNILSLDTPDCDENSLKVHISNIRKKIKKITNTEYIEAVWGIGFKIHEKN